ncbi:hypothetical protein DXG01_010043 [Tephrocybe rancida]|nr:hypothetical protein DXG01_010043 [Tephrocybe rancida]
MGFDVRAKSKGEYCFMAGLGPISGLLGQGQGKESKYTVYTPKEDPRYRIAAKIVLCHHCDWVYILSQKSKDILECPPPTVLLERPYRNAHCTECSEDLLGTAEELSHRRRHRKASTGVAHSDPDKTFTYAEWGTLSDAFAKTVSGHVYVLLGKEVNPTSVWLTIEKPELEKSLKAGKVTGIEVGGWFIQEDSRRGQGYGGGN